MKIEIEYNEDDYISSFAYGIGKSLEQAVEMYTDGLIEKNQDISAKILSYINTLEGEELERYKKHFDIETLRVNKDVNK